MAAILEAHRAGLLGARYWPANLVAGVIVGVVALPLAMAFAIASGAKPEQGLYTAIVAGFVVAVAGGSRVQIAGPTGAFVVILSGVTADHGVAGLQVATVMAGLILVLLGLARLGTIIKYIPDPVIAGFTAGIGVIIWVGQWPEFFGLEAVAGEHFHDRLIDLLAALPHLDGPTTALALVSLVAALFGPRLPGLRRVPGPVIALLVGTGLATTLGLDGVRTIGSAFGGVPRGLPEFALPRTSLGEVLKLIGPAFTIAMLGAIESLLSATVADGMAGTRHDSNQELIGQGLANLVAPLFGGFAATGAIARTATNIRNGGTSPLAGITHSATLLAVVLLAAPLAARIPLATLAAILFVVAWNMSDLRHCVRMVRRAPRADVVILLVTFVLTVFADLVIAVNIGVILATLQFLRRMAESVEVRAPDAAELARECAALGLDGVPPGVLVYAIEGPFFFGAVETFERALAGTGTDPQVLIIRLRWVPFVDITALQTLEEVITGLRGRGVEVLLSGPNARVKAKLRRAGITGLVGEERQFDAFGDALDCARRLAATA
jgi:SulP family sulfate permease